MIEEGIVMDGPVAFMEASSSAVFFSKGSASAGTAATQSTAPRIKKLETALAVAYWGEDNRFPQNIEKQMAYCGVGKAALDFKARSLYGAGIIPGTITGINPDGTEEFTPLDRSTGKKIYEFLENRAMFRFLMEYFQDWTWFYNCFPEVILSMDGSEITGFVHQESCDARFKQMNDDGVIDTVYLSKMWGMSSDQFAKFDPEKRILGITENPTQLTEVDNKFLIALDCIDMYDSVNSLKKIAAKLVQQGKEFKSAILPVNYSSPNKTYYQVPTWDGARLAGWVEIAAKIPSLFKTLYNKAFRLKYHIEVPQSYFETKFGTEIWKTKSEIDKKKARKDLLTEMNEYLSGEKKAFSSMVSFFEYDKINKAEYGRIKITAIEDKTNLDKDFITGSAANIEILTAMGVHPTLIGSGTIGTGTQRTGGSDQREAQLIFNANLNLERQVALEPLYLARDYNGWDPALVFRIRDTQLTTLDQNAGTKKVVS